MAALSLHRCVVFLARPGCAEEGEPLRLTRKLKGLQTLHRYKGPCNAFNIKQQQRTRIDFPFADR